MARSAPLGAPGGGPLLDVTPNLRQRQRADGTWRIWWEPNAAARAVGMAAKDLSQLRPGDASRKAAALNAEAARKAKAGDKVSAAPAPNSVAAVIHDYRQSLAFTEKPASTRAGYASNLRAIEDKWGPQPVRLIDETMMDLWYEALYRGRSPHRAYAIIGMMSILMRHAERRRLRPRGSNPCRDIDRKKPKGRSRVGSWPELDALDAAARDLARKGTPWARHLHCALMLVIYGGQRQTDIWLARPDQFHRIMLQGIGDAAPRPLWVWSLVRSKRGNAGMVPIATTALPILRWQLMRAPSGPGTLIWDAGTGLPFTRYSFFKRWEELRATAAKACPSVSTLQWRDLRRTFGHLSRQGGAGRDDVADVLGNTADTNPELAATYMGPQLATTLRAVQAVQRPMPKGKTA